LSGFNVNPKFVENYDGSEIELNPIVFLKPSEFPSLKNYIGETLITTDGTTLLGADDKAGIAEIITAISYLVEHPEIKRPTIKIAFTPDEEIGRGANKFDVPFFNADFAYTIDGGEIGELEYENFNAAGCKILVDGLNVHPGSAKNTMINAIEIGLEFHSLLPEFQKPQYTENDEGFFHLVDFSGSVEDASLSYIIRDHNINKFEDKKKLIETSAKFINDKYGRKIISFEIIDQYKNMKEKILPFMHIIDTAKDVMDELSIPVQIKAIRGGTDGARLSYMGLPCPNIFTGGHNFHGRYEYIPVSSMEKAVEVIIGISKKYA
jgi:tripeptide aminopeptidase